MTGAKRQAFWIRARSITVTFFAALIAITATVMVILALTFTLSPTPTLYGERHFSSAVFDRNGQLLRLTLADDDRFRLFTPLSAMPPNAVEATLLYEDQWFHYHPGVNPISLARAGWQTFITRTRTVGASTITMQLARMRFSLDSSSLSGKVVQIFRALQLEWHYSKSDILEAYLNIAPYGGNIEGIGTASLIYFNKQASELTLIEALSLIVIPQNPLARAPISAGSTYHQDSIASNARQRAFALWRQHHPEDAHWADTMRLPLATRQRAQLPFFAPHFVDHLLASRGSGNWRSSLDLPLQQLTEQQIKDTISNRHAEGIHNAAVLIVDTRDTSVAAWVGSADWFNDSIHGQVDGVRAKRSPGSTLKPFIYALALEQGLIHSQSLLADLPTRFGAYTPENFDRGYLGPIAAQDALIYSRNVPAVALANQLSPDFYHFLQHAGISPLREREFYGLAIALGGVEVSMVELAQLYASFANGGDSLPLALTHDEAADRPAVRLFSPEAAFITRAMLTENPRPRHARDRLRQHLSNRPPAPVAWKTGTSWAFRDAWSIGLSGDYLVAVWVGNFDGSSNPAFVGSTAGAPLLFDIIDQLQHIDAANTEGKTEGRTTTGTRDSSEDNFYHLNVKKVSVCAASGDLPNQYCPKTKPTWYIPGVSPIRVSTVHQRVDIDEHGFRSCHPDATNTRTHIMEFWPSDFLALFKLAGLPRKQPPPYAPDCALSDIGNQGIAPTIKSPSPRLEYTLRATEGAQNSIPLQAVADAGAQTLYWFEDDRFITSTRVDNSGTASTETLEWSPSPGQYVIRAVDDLGRSDAVTITVRLLPE